MALGTPPTSPPNHFFGKETFKGGSLFGPDKDDIESPLQQKAQQMRTTSSLAASTPVDPSLPEKVPPEVMDDSSVESEASVRDTIVVKYSLFVSDDDTNSEASELAEYFGDGNDCYGSITTDEDKPSPKRHHKKATKYFTDKEAQPQQVFLDKLTIKVPSNELLVPRSSFEPFDPPATQVSEAKALKALSDSGQQPSDGFIEYTLDDFVIYCDKPGVYENEMRSLHCVRITTASSPLYFDGIISRKGRRFYIKRAVIQSMPIENYIDTDLHTVRGHIWLETELSRAHNGYYRLLEPAQEYERFFTPFMWLADLTKHFVDFMDRKHDDNLRVSIHDFKESFSNWMQDVHGHSTEFIAWRQQYPRQDFRTAVVANASFLYKEACGVLEPQEVDFHTIWSEIQLFNHYKRSPSSDKKDRTIVTEYVYDCFRKLPCGSHMKVAYMANDISRQHTRLVQERGMEKSAAINKQQYAVESSTKPNMEAIKCGVTISTMRDDNDQAVWKHRSPLDCTDADRWFARVDRVNVDKGGNRSFDVIWYYRPSDTLCGVMRYPWKNELFFSTHCSCNEKHKITEDEVLGIHDVEFWGTSETTKEFFCRQTYIHEERKWITLQEEHLSCVHRREHASHPELQIGNTLLVQRTTRSSRSEPCEIVAIYEDDLGRTKFSLRRLLRRQDVVDGTHSPVNEVVYTDQIFDAPESRIVGRCGVKHFVAGEEITAPFDRDGVGCLFFMTHKLVDGGYGPAIIPLAHCPASLRQHKDLEELNLPKLRGLDLFCGGGNFGRGLEDAGAIEVKWANDFDDRALHTYMANCKSHDSVEPFLGSINELNRRAVRGQFGQGIPKIGDVDFIAGGSPCPGFSNLTNDKTTPEQRKNQSLVAAFATSVDLHRPKFGLLENVPGIIQPQVNRDEDVFSQLVCALVGMGYQTRLFFLDAASCGAAQMRSRVFVVFAAPGYTLPRRPQQSHMLPLDTKKRKVGRLPTGEPMAEREFSSSCPFTFITASAATNDLTAIGDAKPDICVEFPDHRVAASRTKQSAERFALIPKRPYGMNFKGACYGIDGKPGTLSRKEKSVFLGTSETMSTSALSGAYGRVRPDKPFATIVTHVSPRDGKNGRVLHWDEDRIITIMEARRAQGFRDEDVILGTASNQYKIVGNSVSREVAVALGICFLEAYQEGYHAPETIHRRATTSKCGEGSVTSNAVVHKGFIEPLTPIRGNVKGSSTGKRESSGPNSTRPRKSPRRQTLLNTSKSPSSSPQEGLALRQVQKKSAIKVLLVDSDDSS